MSHALLYFDDGPESNEIVSEGIAVIYSIGVRRRGPSSSTNSSSSSGGKRKYGTTGAKSGIKTIVVITATPACNKTNIHGWLQCFSSQKPSAAEI